MQISYRYIFCQFLICYLTPTFETLENILIIQLGTFFVITQGKITFNEICYFMNLLILPYLYLCKNSYFLYRKVGFSIHFFLRRLYMRKSTWQQNLYKECRKYLHALITWYYSNFANFNPIRIKCRGWILFATQNYSDLNPIWVQIQLRYLIFYRKEIGSHLNPNPTSI